MLRRFHPVGAGIDRLGVAAAQADLARDAIASGISRTRSIDSRPSLRSASRTVTWSARPNRRSNDASQCRDG